MGIGTGSFDYGGFNWNGFDVLGPVGTGVVSADWAIQMEFNGTGNGWTDVTSDVRAEDHVMVSYGMRGVTATDRVASTGTMRFTLNNGPTNSAKLTGYYAPDNTNVRSGFALGIRCRLALTYQPIGTVYRFLGTLDSAKPTAGVKGRYLTKCIVVDWLDEASRAHVTGLGLETNVTGDVVFKNVVSTIPVQPAAIQTSVGLDTYPYALDNVKDETTTVMQIFQALAMSELGYIYIKSDAIHGGTLTYESRSTRGKTTTNVQTFSNTMDSVEITRSRSQLLNRVLVTSHPRKVDATNNTVLFNLNTATAVGPGETVLINGPFRDPGTGQYARSGGTSMQQPVADTDYKTNTKADGTGADLTASFTVTASYSSNSATFSITNNTSQTGYIGGGTSGAFLQARGQGIYDYNNAITIAENTANQQQYGERIANIDMPNQADPAVANEAANYILNVYSFPLSTITKLTLLGNWSDALMQAVLLRDISDSIGLAETITGVKGTTRYFINGVDLDISPGRVFRISFILAPADQNRYWYLEVVGSSELDQTTRLGYGLIVGHVDVLHADSHGDVTHIDVAHSDSHTDDAHQDVAHGDGASHGDTAHADVAHTDVAHSDANHSDAHNDTAHTDSAHIDSHSDVAHSDVAHADSHTDIHVDHDDAPARHQDSHFDQHDDSHSDIAHDDSHNDTAHGDVAHDDSHGDTAHGDTAHSDTAHMDVAHSDNSGHADSAHVDTAHGDVAHGDSAHNDTAHTDTHGDTAHGDIN